MRKFRKKTSVSESIFRKVAGLQPCSYIKKRLQHWCFPVKFAKFLRTSTVKNIFERLLLFVSPQNTIAKSSGEFELYKTLSIQSIFLNITILFDQMLSQLKNVSLTFQLTLLLNLCTLLKYSILHLVS